jgi:hypothetical protein
MARGKHRAWDVQPSRSKIQTISRAQSDVDYINASSGNAIDKRSD